LILFREKMKFQTSNFLQIYIYIYIYLVTSPLKRSPPNQQNMENTTQKDYVAGQMQIHIKFHSGPTIEAGKTITLDVKASDTLASIKAKIQELEGIAAEYQVFSHSAWTPQDDSQPLSYYQIKNESILYLHQKFDIHVSYSSGRTHSLRVLEGETVEHLKTLISRIDDVDVRWMKLTLGSTVMSDYRRLREFNLKPGDGLGLVISEPTFDVQVQIHSREDVDDKKIVLTVRGSDTLDNVKAMIQYKEGISPNAQHLRLLYRGPLDLTRTLEEEGINHSSILQCFVL
jgi:ubiquitin C